MNIPFPRRHGRRGVGAGRLRHRCPLRPTSIAQAVAAMKASFRDQGIAKVDRLNQDLGQQACSSPTAPPPERGQADRGRSAGQREVARRRPVPGRLARRREAGAERPRHDLDRRVGAPKANGGNCYNCHQIDKTEISFGTIGPSL